MGTLIGIVLGVILILMGFASILLFRIYENLDSMNSIMSNFLREYMEEARRQKEKDESA